MRVYLKSGIDYHIHLFLYDICDFASSLIGNDNQYFEYNL